MCSAIVPITPSSSQTLSISKKCFNDRERLSLFAIWSEIVSRRPQSSSEYAGSTGVKLIFFTFSRREPDTMVRRSCRSVLVISSVRKVITSMAFFQCGERTLSGGRFAGYFFCSEYKAWASPSRRSRNHTNPLTNSCGRVSILWSW
jgi:hypothetical protein